MMEGLRFRGYKSFQGVYVDIPEIEKINIFIGKNNSGKSSCLDIIENLIAPEILARNKFLKDGLEIQIIHELSEEEIRYVFPENTYGGVISTRNHYEFGKQYIGKKMRFSVFPSMVGHGSREKIFSTNMFQMKQFLKKGMFNIGKILEEKKLILG